MVRRRRELVVDDHIEAIVERALHEQLRDETLVDQTREDGLERGPVQLLEVPAREESVGAFVQGHEDVRIVRCVGGPASGVDGDGDEPLHGLDELRAATERVEHHAARAPHGVAEDVVGRFGGAAGEAGDAGGAGSSSRARGERHEPRASSFAGRHHALEHVLHGRRGQPHEEGRHRRDLAEIGQRRDVAQRFEGAEHAREVAGLPERRRVGEEELVVVGLHVLGLVVLVARVICRAVARPVVHPIVQQLERGTRDERHEARLRVRAIARVVRGQGLRQAGGVVVGVTRRHARAAHREQPRPRRDGHAHGSPELQRIAHHPRALVVCRARLCGGELDPSGLRPRAHARLVLLVGAQRCPAVFGHLRTSTSTCRLPTSAYGGAALTQTRRGSVAAPGGRGRHAPL